MSASSAAGKNGYLYTDKDGLDISAPIFDSPSDSAKTGRERVAYGTDIGGFRSGEIKNWSGKAEPGLQASSVGGSFNIVLNKSAALSGNAGASAAFDRAAEDVESLFGDNITVYINADFSNLGSGVLRRRYP